MSELCTKKDPCGCCQAAHRNRIGRLDDEFV